MGENKAVSSGGIGFGGALSIVLIVMKLLGKISISWFWCFFPVLFVPLIILFIFIVVGIVALILTIMKNIERKRLL